MERMKPTGRLFSVVFVFTSLSKSLAAAPAHAVLCSRDAKRKALWVPHHGWVSQDGRDAGFCPTDSTLLVITFHRPSLVSVHCLQPECTANLPSGDHSNFPLLRSLFL